MLFKFEPDSPASHVKKSFSRNLEPSGHAHTKSSLGLSKHKWEQLPLEQGFEAEIGYIIVLKIKLCFKKIFGDLT